MKRVKVQPKCPNPLFVSWLEAWKQDAKSKGSDMQYCFDKALNSMKKYPLPLKSGRECLVLHGVGLKLSSMLDKKMAEYKAANVNDSAFLEEPFNSEEQNGEKRTETPAAVKRAKKSKASEAKKTKTPSDGGDNGHETASRNTGPYIPTWRSGGYAILLALYENYQRPDYKGYMNKADLQSDAQKHCDASMKVADPGCRYTAWSSMKTLLANGLVSKTNNPAKYRLTDAGFDVAMQLSKVVEDNFQELGSSAQFSIRSQGSQPSTSSGEKLSQPFDDDDVEILSFTNGKNVSNEEPKGWRQKRAGYHLQSVDIKAQTNSQQSVSSGDDRTIVLKPKSFDIILLVDDRETAGAKTRPVDDKIIYALTQTGVRFEVRNLKIGDFAWIAKCRESGEELVLPYIVERKRMDDLGSSIKDGRYREQKFRLKKSGIQNIIYLVENHGNNQFAGLPLTTLFQAATNTLVQDEFNVKYTKSHRESVLYLACFTVQLIQIYQEKTLIGCRKENLPPAEIVNDVIYLMGFKEFNKAAAKVKIFKAKEMFIRHLIQLHGLSVEKAVAIVDFYPTPTALRKAFEEAGSTGERLLAEIQFGSLKRQIGPALSKTLHQFYTRKNF